MTFCGKQSPKTMNKRPTSITVLGWLFIAFGSIALLSNLLPLVNSSATQRIADLKAHWIIHVARLVAPLCGVFMLYGFNWARWLLLVWLGFHVIISVLHSPLQLLLHCLLFAVVVYFLFRPRASAYFRGRRAEPSQIPKADDTGVV
jgi:hypothetical protein